MGVVNILSIVAGLAFIAFGVFVIAVGLRASYLYYRVMATGVRCKAKVVGAEIVSTHRGHHGYAMKVTFTYYSEELQTNQKLTKRYSSKTYLSPKPIDKQLGKEVDILYSKERPDFVTSTSRWINVKNYLQLIAIMVFVGILPIILGVLIVNECF